MVTIWIVSLDKPRTEVRLGQTDRQRHSETDNTERERDSETYRDRKETEEKKKEVNTTKYCWYGKTAIYFILLYNMSDTELSIFVYTCEP